MLGYLVYFYIQKKTGHYRSRFSEQGSFTLLHSVCNFTGPDTPVHASVILLSPKPEMVFAGRESVRLVKVQTRLDACVYTLSFLLVAEDLIYSMDVIIFIFLHYFITFL